MAIGYVKAAILEKSLKTCFLCFFLTLAAKIQMVQQVGAPYAIKTNKKRGFPCVAWKETFIIVFLMNIRISNTIYQSRTLSQMWNTP